MSYEPPKTPRLVGKILAAAIVMLFVCVSVSAITPRLQDYYAARKVKQAMLTCGTEHGLTPEWVDATSTVTFDAEHRYFYAHSEGDRAFVDCLAKLVPESFDAGPYSDDCEDPKASLALSRIVSGQNYSPPAEYFSFSIIECTHESARLQEQSI
ncbi:hypothetical protein [Parerythrobacter lacustris]|uniref:Uncharacterized protein n=1 Tax=Parerythrobacter lacustris TaxID=2969984 RepID=A0ABT1XQK9_9SPHN|nr:hypothetical protein [Parerythrobacter lacustris]MCR2833945.1 hypothetical protein [Parerythrobacter lacustris]